MKRDLPPHVYRLLDGDAGRAAFARLREARGK